MEPEPQPRILVVEDEKTVSLIVRRLLESKLACDVKIADCCDAARRELASSNFELITLDYQLPDGNGLELLEEINSSKDSPPVIMVTGHGDEATAVEAFKLGASGYVVKDKRMGTLLVEEAEKALELRRALRTLTEREQRLRMLTDNMVDVVTQVDAEGHIVYVSPSVERVSGFTQEEAMGMHAELVAHPDDSPEVDRIRSEAIARGDSLVKLESRNMHKTRGWIWMESVGRLLYDENGDFTGAIYSSRDVTDRKRSEGLVEAQRDLAIALSGISDTRDILQLAVERVLEVTGLDCGGIYILNQHTGDLKLEHNFGTSEEFTSNVGPFNSSSRIFEVIRTGEPIYLPNFEREPLNPIVQKEGLRFIAALPLRYEGDVVGCLNVGSYSLDDLPDYLRKFLVGLAGLVGQAVGRSSLQAAIRESDERYRQLYENISEAVFAYDDDAVLTGMNRKAAEMLGYTEEELLGRRIRDLGIIHPEDLKKTIAARHRLFETGEPQTINLRYILKSGEVIEVYAVTSAVLTDDGEVVGAQVVSTDVTEQKKAREAVRDIEERYRLLFEGMAQGVYTYDRDGILTDVNPAMVELLGYSREETLGKRILELNALHPDDVPMASVFLEKLLSGKSEVERNRYRFITKSGEIKDLDVTSCARKDIDGNVISVSVVAIDMTEQTRAIAALRESEELWRTLIETSPDPIVMTDMEGRIIALSEKAKELRTSTDGDVEERLAFEFIDGDDLHVAEEAFKTLGNGGSVGTVEYNIKNPDGSIMIVESNMSCILDSTGKPRATISVIRDVTERKRIEEELRRMNEELESYAQTVSHDLKGPLSALIAATDLLEQSLKVGDSHQALEELARLIKSDAMLTYGRVEDLLTLAKAGQSPVDPVDVDVGSLMDDVLTELADLIDEKGATVDVAPDLGHIRANRLQLTQVLSNLVSNALLHGSAPAPRIEVSYLGQTAPDEHKYTVCDNGPGLAPGTEESIFEPFVKGMSASGTGIGLSIVERIIHAYDGDIQAHNNNGACFEFTLRDA
ncbi:MAG TPA: PAS domain S-box protein [Candidatus Anoxymicrobiaceae bacterium]